MKQIHRLCALFIILTCAYIDSVIAAASSSGSKQAQLQLHRDDADLVVLVEQADKNGLIVGGRLANIDSSNFYSANLYSVGVTEELVQAKLGPRRDRCAFGEGMGLSMLISAVGGMSAYMFRRKLEHIPAGISFSFMPYLLYSAHNMFAAQSIRMQEIGDRMHVLESQVSGAQQALSEFQYIDLIKKCKETVMAPHDLREHLAEEELARLDFMKNLENKEHDFEASLNFVRQQSGDFKDRCFSWSEGALYGSVACMTVSTGMALYHVIIELNKRKSITGSYFR